MDTLAQDALPVTADALSKTPEEAPAMPKTAATAKLKKPTAKATPVVPAAVPKAPPMVLEAPGDAESKPAEPAFKVLAFGSTAFKMDFTLAVPDVPLAQARAPELPFRGWFTEALACLTPERNQVHIYLPDTFWTKTLGRDPAIVKSGYVRGKLRNAFTTWRMADEKKRSVLELLIYPRPHGIPDDPTPGYSVWLRLKA